MKPVRIGPFPRGVDTFHDPNHRLFQVGRRDKGHYERLTAADNLSLDDEGNLFVRPGLTEILAATAGMTCFSGAGLLLQQDEGVVSSVDPDTGTPTSLVSGLSDSATIQFVEQAGKVFGTDGTDHFMITSAGVASNWGQTVPPVATLGTTAGDLPAGRYRVACVLIDGNGAKSGAPKAAAVTVDGTKDITVTLSSADANAVYARIYASFTDSDEMYFVSEVAIGALPATITAVNESNEILDTQFLSGPQGLPNIVGISKWLGYLLLWRDTRVMHSDGNRHHLFDLRTAPWKFPSTVRAAAGVGKTCWIATDRGIFTYIGEPPLGELSDPLDKRAYAAGYAIVPVEKLPFLGGKGFNVVLFASEDGLAVGFPDGSMRHEHMHQTKWDVAGKTASIIYRETDDLAEVIVNLE